MTDEAKCLKTQYLNKDNEEERQKILNRMLDITDTRTFCDVVSKEDGIPCVRHIFRVTEDAEKHLDLLKEEYNDDYSQLSTDEFFFFTGFHRAEEFSRMK